jgi:hypothetical protein
VHNLHAFLQDAIENYIWPNGKAAISPPQLVALAGNSRMACDEIEALYHRIDETIRDFNAAALDGCKFPGAIEFSANFGRKEVSPPPENWLAGEQAIEASAASSAARISIRLRSRFSQSDRA